MRWTACEPILADKPYWGERAAAPGRRPRPPPARSRPSGPPAIARTPRSRPTRAPTPTTAGRMRPLAQGPVGQGGGGAQEKGRWRQKRGRPARKAPGGQAGQRGTARKPKPTRSKTHTALNRHRRKSVKIEKTGSLPATSRKRSPFRSRHHAARHQQVRLRAAEPRARYGTSGRGRVRQERGCRDGQNCVDRMRTAGSRKKWPAGASAGRRRRPQHGQEDGHGPGGAGAGDHGGALGLRHAQHRRDSAQPRRQAGVVPDNDRPDHGNGRLDHA